MSCRDFPRSYIPTSRETDVLWALVQTDGTARVISQRLKISPVTVNTHINGLFRSLDLHTRVELVVWWLEVGRYQPALSGPVRREQRR